MRVKVVKGYDVPGEDFLLEEDMPELTERYQCSECDEIYEDRDDARDCCKD